MGHFCKARGRASHLDVLYLLDLPCHPLDVPLHPVAVGCLVTVFVDPECGQLSDPSASTGDLPVCLGLRSLRRRALITALGGSPEALTALIGQVDIVLDRLRDEARLGAVVEVFEVLRDRNF